MVMVDGDKPTIIGKGLLMLKFTEEDKGAMPHIPEFVTVIAATPAKAMFAAGTQAPSRPEVMKAVASGLLFQQAMDVETKLEPLMTTSKSGPPARAVEGENEEIEGTGLLPPVIVNLTDGEAM